MWAGLKIEPGPTRPGLTEADVSAIKEVVRRKAAGFWAEDTTRTTVRKFAHDCIPTGPPVSSQPHSLRGESAHRTKISVLGLQSSQTRDAPTSPARRRAAKRRALEVRPQAWHTVHASWTRTAIDRP